MAVFRTSRGRPVSHCHVRPHPTETCDATEWSRAQREHWRRYMARHFPNSVEVRAPSRKYNCFGYAYARAHGWFEDPDLFIKDDFMKVSMDKARRGDVLVYEKSGEMVHAAIVNEVADGKIEKVRSKWAKLAAVIHKPREVHRAYGHPAKLLRRNPH
jgi:hypothetical protein